MTSAETQPRLLRPGALALLGGRLWVLDRLQPVAAVLDVVSGHLVTVVGWSELPPGPEPGGRRVLPSADGLWVQQPDGPVVLVGDGGVIGAYFVDDHELSAVSDHGAWCVPRPEQQDLAESVDEPPADEPRGELRLLRPGRPTHVVRCDAAVRSLRSSDGGLFLEVDDDTWSRHSLGMTDAGPPYELVRGSTWLRLRADEEVPDRLLVASCEPGDPPATSDSDDWPGSDHVAEPARAISSGGLEWRVGADRTARWDAPVVVATAHDPGEDHPRHHLSLGPGFVVDVTADAHHVWVSIEQPDAEPLTAGAAPVVRIDTGDGTVTPCPEAESVDATEHCWPLEARPLDHDDYVAHWQRHLGRLDAFWEGEGSDDGLEPIVDGLSGTEVVAVGDWPDTVLDVSFTWDRYPGERLRRRIPLYDEMGRRTEMEDVDIEIMEDLETNRLVPERPSR